MADHGYFKMEGQSSDESSQLQTNHSPQVKCASVHEGANTPSQLSQQELQQLQQGHTQAVSVVTSHEPIMQVEVQSQEPSYQDLVAQLQSESIPVSPAQSGEICLQQPDHGQLHRVEVGQNQQSLMQQKVQLTPRNVVVQNVSTPDQLQNLMTGQAKGISSLQTNVKVLNLPQQIQLSQKKKTPVKGQKKTKEISPELVKSFTKSPQLKQVLGETHRIIQKERQQKQPVVIQQKVASPCEDQYKQFLKQREKNEQMQATPCEKQYHQFLKQRQEQDQQEAIEEELVEEQSQTHTQHVKQTQQQLLTTQEQVKKHLFQKRVAEIKQREEQLIQQQQQQQIQQQQHLQLQTPVHPQQRQMQQQQAQCHTQQQRFQGYKLTNAVNQQSPQQLPKPRQSSPQVSVSQQCQAKRQYVIYRGSTRKRVELDASIAPEIAAQLIQAHEAQYIQEQQTPQRQVVLNPQVKQQQLQQHQQQQSVQSVVVSCGAAASQSSMADDSTDEVLLLESPVKETVHLTTPLDAITGKQSPAVKSQNRVPAILAKSHSSRQTAAGAITSTCQDGTVQSNFTPEGKFLVLAPDAVCDRQIKELLQVTSKPSVCPSPTMTTSSSNTLLKSVLMTNSQGQKPTIVVPYGKSPVPRIAGNTPQGPPRVTSIQSTPRASTPGVQLSSGQTVFTVGTPRQQISSSQMSTNILAAAGKLDTQAVIKQIQNTTQGSMGQRPVQSLIHGSPQKVALVQQVGSTPRAKTPCAQNPRSKSVVKTMATPGVISPGTQQVVAQNVAYNNAVQYVTVTRDGQEPTVVATPSLMSGNNMASVINSSAHGVVQAVSPKLNSSASLSTNMSSSLINAGAVRNPIPSEAAQQIHGAASRPASSIITSAIRMQSPGTPRFGQIQGQQVLISSQGKPFLLQHSSPQQTGQSSKSKIMLMTTPQSSKSPISQVLVPQQAVSIAQNVTTIGQNVLSTSGEVSHLSQPQEALIMQPSNQATAVLQTPTLTVSSQDRTQVANQVVVTVSKNQNSVETNQQVLASRVTVMAPAVSPPQSPTVSSTSQVRLSGPRLPVPYALPVPSENERLIGQVYMLARPDNTFMCATWDGKYFRVIDGLKLATETPGAAIISGWEPGNCGQVRGGGGGNKKQQTKALKGNSTGVNMLKTSGSPGAQTQAIVNGTRVWQHSTVGRDKLSRPPLHLEQSSSQEGENDQPDGEQTGGNEGETLIRKRRPTEMGKFAVCPSCGTTSDNYDECVSCHRALPDKVNYYWPSKVQKGEAQMVAISGDQAKGPTQYQVILQQAAQIQHEKESVLSKKAFYGAKIKQYSQIYFPAESQAAGGKPPTKRIRTVKKHAEPETVTILSSDDEESPENKQQTEQQPQIEQSPSTSRTSSPSAQAQTSMQCVKLGRRQQMEDEVSNAEKTGNAPKKKVSKLVIPNIEAGTEVEFNVRAIRIGSLRAVPYAPVVLTLEGIVLLMEVPEKTEESIEVKLEPKDIIHILAHTGNRLPVMFILVTPTCAAHLRNRCLMAANSEPYFDPGSSDERHKHLVLILQDMSSPLRNIMNAIFEKILLPASPGARAFQEIDYDVANMMLVQSSPVSANMFMASGFEDGFFDGEDEDEEELMDRSRSPSPPHSVFMGPVIRLFTYPPPPATGGIAVSNEDLFCLNEGEFLNDVIIDFYLKYLFNEKLSAIDRARTHIFSSFFYRRLTQKDAPNSQPANVKLTAPQKRHARVRTWTRHVDLFDKDFIIVPINESAHWYLAIICFPGLIAPVIAQDEISSQTDSSPNPNLAICKTEETEESSSADTESKAADASQMTTESTEDKGKTVQSSQTGTVSAAETKEEPATKQEPETTEEPEKKEEPATSCSPKSTGKGAVTPRKRRGRPSLKKKLADEEAEMKLEMKAGGRRKKAVVKEVEKKVEVEKKMEVDDNSEMKGDTNMDGIGEMPPTIIKDKKGGHKLLMPDGFIYRRHKRESDTRVRWECVHKQQEKCCSRMGTAGHDFTVLAAPTQHSHGPDQNAIYELLSGTVTNLKPNWPTRPSRSRVSAEHDNQTADDTAKMDTLEDSATDQSQLCDKQEESMETDQLEKLTLRQGACVPVKPPPQRVEKAPCILIFDSLSGPARGGVIRLLRDYLQVEWDTKKATKVGAREFDRDRVKGGNPKCPQQTNFSDCGVYVLQYVESFFESPIRDYNLPMKCLAEWFSDEVVLSKREELMQLLLSLQKELNPDLQYDPSKDIIKTEPLGDDPTV